MASGTYTLTNIQRQHTCTVSWSTSRSSSTSTSVTVSLTLKITCGTYTDFSSPAGDSDLCINGTWDSSGGSGKGGYGGLSLTKGKSWSKSYTSTITWASSSNITCQVYVDYYAGGWGPSPNGGTTQSFSVSVPTYQSYTNPVAGTTSCSYSNNSFSISWSGFKNGTSNAITTYELWYQESSDNSTWSDRARVPGYTNRLSPTSYTWTGGTWNKYYRFCAVALGTVSGTYSSTSAWGNSVRKYATSCGAPTTITIRSGSSTTSSALSTQNCGSTNFYIHWSAGTAGTNNPIVGYSVYYRNKTTNGSWTKLRDVNSTTTRYTSDTWTTSYDYEYSVQTRGGAGSRYYSGYGTYTATIGMVPTNPTSVTFTNGGTYNSLVSINHPTLGSSYLAGWTQLSSATALTISGTMSGATGPRYYRISYGIFAQNQSAQGTSPPTPSVVGWTSLTSTATSTTLSFARQRIEPGQVLRFRIDTVGYNGRTSTGYYYTPCILGAGTTSYKVSGAWKDKSIRYVKINGAWKTPVMVWRKISGAWKQSF